MENEERYQRRLLENQEKANERSSLKRAMKASGIQRETYLQPDMPVKRSLRGCAS